MFYITITMVHFKNSSLIVQIEKLSILLSLKICVNNIYNYDIKVKLC